MKKIFLALCCLYSVVFNAQNNNTSPNIVVFLVDDMGWQDTSVPFWSQVTANNKKYYTPNMERLAQKGMKLTQGYASAVCSPSRVSIITGSNTARHRVSNWTLLKNTPTDVENKTLLPPNWNVNGIGTEPNTPNAYYATPLPKILKDNGYHTICIGKAHFGAKDTPSENPLNLGFDINIAGHFGGGLPTYSGLNNFGNRTDGGTQSPFAIPHLEKYWGKDISVTEALTLEAINTLNNRPKHQPFFLYLSHYAVHSPIEADNRFYQKYLDKGYEPTEAKYASMVEAMDKSLGDLMNYLNDNQLTENTFILFLSDNGGLSALARGGQPHTHNAPLNSGKGSAYEGGIRIPMIAFWKGQIESNSQSDTPIIIEDLFPTLLNVANIQVPKTPQVIDGKSFVPTLKGKKHQKKRALYWHFPNNWYHIEGHGLGASSTIRWGDWKLIYFHENQKLELFNLKQDIGETQDLSQKYPKITKKLTKKLAKYLQKTQAQMPIIKATGQPVPYPKVK